MSYLEELLPEFRNGAKIRQPNWGKGEYIYLGENGIIYDERNKPFDFTNEEIFVEWELYTEPAPDWDYIVKNKCLCWFGVIGREKQKVGTLRKIAEFRGSYTYYIDEDTGFSACRPVRKDEITFYENKNDD